jgi:hypothetical protein
MHCRGIHHEVGAQLFQAFRHRIDVEDFDVRVSEGTDLIPVSCKSIHDIDAKLAVGPDHGDLHRSSAPASE